MNIMIPIGLAAGIDIDIDTGIGPGVPRQAVGAWVLGTLGVVTQGVATPTPTP